MHTTRSHIAIILLLAIGLHLPVFIGILKPVPPNFTWWAPWDESLNEEPVKGGYYDYLQEYLPWQKYLHDSVGDGELPLWNRFQFCGTPFLANHLLSPFYPPITLGLAFPFELAAYVTSLLNFIIGPLFMYLYLKRLKIDPRAALFGGLVFCSSGFFTPFLPPWTAAIVWVPAILYILESWMQGIRRWRDVAWMGLIIGIWTMEGYPVFVVHAIYFIILYILIFSRQGLRLTVLRNFIIALILGALISAIQNLPTLFFALDSVRFIPRPDELLETSLTLKSILNHLTPSQDGVFKTGYLFAGMLPVVFIPFSFIRIDRHRLYFLTWSLLCIITGLWPWLFKIFFSTLPLWDITPHPPILPLFLSLAVLAGYGFNNLLNLTPETREQTRKAVLFSVILFIIIFLLRTSVGMTDLTLLYLTLILGLLILMALPVRSSIPDVIQRLGRAIALFLTLMIIALPWLINLRLNQPLEKLYDTPYYRDYLAPYAGPGLRIYRTGWQQDLPPNMGILWGLEDAGGYDSLILKNFKSAFDKSDINFYRGRESQAIEGPFSLKWDSTEKYSAGIILASPGLPITEAPLWEKVVDGSNRANIYINRNIWRATFFPENGGPKSMTPLKYSIEGPNSILVTLDNDHPVGKVRIRDTYADGWKAWVDGAPTHITQFDGWMREVEVPPGAKEIVMRYDPPEFKIGAVISILGLFIALMGIAGGYEKRLRSPE